jgi:3-hydroxyacyl-[acyl-carrier-protein] dehydratase
MGDAALATERDAAGVRIRWSAPVGDGMLRAQRWRPGPFERPFQRSRPPAAASSRGRALAPTDLWRGFVRLLFVDRVTHLTYRTRIAASVEFAPDDPLFAHHFPGRPLVPASQLLESFAQTATILLETGLGFRRKAIPAFILNAKFHRGTGPGTVAIEMETEQWSDEGAVVRGRMVQSGARCATCTLGMVTAPLGEFFDPAALQGYRQTYARWLDDAVLEGFPEPPLARLEHADR